MDVVHASVTKYSEHMLDYVREQETIVQWKIASLQESHTDFRVPGQIDKKKAAIKVAFGSSGNANEKFQDQLATHNEQFEEIYKYILSDIERICQVLPVKTLSEQKVVQLEKENNELHQSIKSLQFREEMINKSNRSMSAFNSEILRKNLDLEESRKLAIKELEQRLIDEVQKARDETLK